MVSCRLTECQLAMYDAFIQSDAVRRSLQADKAKGGCLGTGGRRPGMMAGTERGAEKMGRLCGDLLQRCCQLHFSCHDVCLLLFNGFIIWHIYMLVV